MPLPSPFLPCPDQDDHYVDGGDDDDGDGDGVNDDNDGFNAFAC